MGTTDDFIPRFVVRDFQDAEALAEMCERDAAKHIKLHNYKHSGPDETECDVDHLTVGNILIVMSMDLREATEFSKRFAQTLDEIQKL